MRDITIEDTFQHDFTTRQFSSGIPTALLGTPVLSVLEGNNATPITAGVSVSVSRASVVGLNEATIVATAANGYEVGKSYAIYISTGTVGGVSVIGEVVGHFTVSASAAAVDLANGTDGLGALKGDTAAILLDTGTDGVIVVTNNDKTALLGSGTAQSGGANSIVLASGDSAVDSFYRGAVIVLTGGTGAGQGELCISYTGSSKTAVMSQNWETAPDATTTYEIYPGHASIQQWFTTGVNGSDIAILNGAGLRTELGMAAADLDTQLGDMKGATFLSATDSLEAIRNRGDAAWTTGAGGSDRLLLADTTIATLATQVSFTLTAGSADNDAYNNCTIVIEDVSTATQKAIGMVLDYVGSTKTVTLKEALAFTIAATDKVYILAENSLKSTVANRQLDVTATGAAGIDWGNVENKATANDLSATDIQLTDTVTTITGLNDPTAAAVADAVWDELLTGSSHNIATSAGRRLRQVEEAFVHANGTIAVVTNGHTFTLDAGAVATTDYYLGDRLDIVEGTGVGQSRLIAGYTSGRVVTLDSDFTTNPDTSSLYEIVAADVHVSLNDADLVSGFIAAAGSTTSVTLDSVAVALADYYLGELLVITHGTGVGQAREITAYSAGRVCTLSPALVTALDTTSVYHVQAAVSVPEIVDEIWDEALSNHQTQGTTSAALTMAAYAGPHGPGVYLDDGAANTGVTLGDDGTVENPVSTIAAVTTIAVALGVQVIYLINDTQATLAQIYEGYTFVGLGLNNKVTLGSQDVDNTEFHNMMLTGTQGGTGQLHAIGCSLTALVSAEIIAERCWLIGNNTLRAATTHIFKDCCSAVAGDATPDLTFPGAGTTEVGFRHYSGGLTVKSGTALDIISFEGDGQLIVDATCTSLTVRPRGNFKLTDNGTTTDIELEAVPNLTNINAEVDTALADYDGPTNAEMEARTLAAASYFDPAADTVADVTAVGSVTGAVGSVAGNVDGNVTGSVGSLAAQAKADVLAEINAALDTAISELAQGVPTATPSIRTGIMLMYMALRNQLDVPTSGTDTLEIHNNAGTRIAQKLLTDDGSDYSEAKMISGA